MNFKTLSKNKKITFISLGVIGALALGYFLTKKDDVPDYTENNEDKKGTKIDSPSKSTKPFFRDYSDKPMSFPIEMGNKGDLVADLQRLLNKYIEKKDATRKKLVVDGVYGSKTYQAHRILQSTNTLPLTKDNFESLKGLVYVLTNV